PTQPSRRRCVDAIRRRDAQCAARPDQILSLQARSLRPQARAAGCRSAAAHRLVGQAPLALACSQRAPSALARAHTRGALVASTTDRVETEASTLQDLARRHLWMHFTRMSAYADHEVPIIVRGEGCYVWDEHGKRYLDGLSALFCVNIGHGRADIAQAGADQAKELGFYTNWSYAHPPAIELAARIASLAPGDLNRVFFTSGGSESVESALKLCRQYWKLAGKPNKYKVIAREIAYHGTSLGALSATGITDLRQPFEPLTPGGCHVPNTNTYRMPLHMTEADLAEAVAERIEFEGPDT